MTRVLAVLALLAGLGGALGWLAFRFPAIDWRGDHPNLARLADKLAERASFSSTTPREA